MGAGEESAGFARYSEHEWSDVRQANWVATRASRPGILRDGKPFWFPPSKKGGFFPMLDINLLRTNPELVKENIRKKFQDEKLVMVDEVVEMDKEYRAAIQQADTLRNQIKVASKQIGMLMGKGQKEEAEKAKEQVAVYKADLEGLAAKEDELQAEIRKRMLVIPNIIDPSVPIGKDDSQNVEIERFGEPVVPDFEIPYHVDIMERLHGIDLDSARKTSGNGFYYLMGDIARLHSAILSYGRDFMIDRGFTYCIPPYMIHGDVVTGVMSFAEMENMMYKIEGEDLYLIGTSEHSMIGKFIDTILDESQLPQTLTSYSPCFRKEVGAHGIEERGVYRIHQFEKQEMIVVCKPEDSPMWFNRLWQNTVDFFRSMDIPVRTLECCSGDLADLKVKSLDVEAWSPRQKKYFEVGSCSNLGDAQARRLKIRVKGDDGRKYFAHTLNNTCVAPPRMLIAFLENNLQADGRVRIPEALRMYMGGKEYIG
jgi:seryl-tRNA synthetase